MPAFSLDDLRRFPDVEAENLFAVDASDRLILDEAASVLSSAVGSEVVVIGDRYGALTLGAASRFGLSGIRVHQDLLTGEQALANNAADAKLGDSFRNLPLGEELLVGARMVLLQLPRSLSELEQIADSIARFAAPDVDVYAGGRIKHLTLVMNDLLSRYFGQVQATRARQKSRVLVASRPIIPTVPPLFPVQEYLSDIDLTVCAYGGVFAGATLDVGTRFLLTFIDRVDSQATSAIDLGCGTGILAAVLAKQRPQLRVLATDQSASAVASAKATMAANFLANVTVSQDAGLLSVVSASVDVILCNPPFHVGSAVHTGAAIALFQDAGRALKPGGQLWTVFNTHLGHQGALGRFVGPTEVVGRNAKFTVTVSTRSSPTRPQDN